jgi:hypothetical protein
VVIGATRASRVKRLAVLATMIVLTGLVLTAGVVVIWVRHAEHEALRQAAEAQTARAALADQLKVVEAKEAERATAEAARAKAAAEALESAQHAAAAGQDAQMSRAELQKTNQQLTQALDSARQASEQERALRERVEKLLVDEQKRNESLIKQRQKIATDLK